MFKNWTLCCLTINSRDKYLRRMLDSVKEETDNGLNIKVLYNCPKDKTSKNLTERLLNDYPQTEVLFYDSEIYGISEGRNYLLNKTETPLISFIDDDCSFGKMNILNKLETTLKETSLGLVGIPSYDKESDTLFKPRENCPKEKIGKIYYMDIEGMFAAGYTELLKEIKGFNERKRFRVEWADLNTKLHRAGITTGIDMDAGFLRHWSNAPNSITRNQPKRIKEFLYGLFVTAIEFGYNNFNDKETRMKEITNKFLLNNYYKDSTNNLFEDILNILPRIINDSEQILKYKSFLDKLPFHFMPFEKICRNDWEKLIEYSEKEVRQYKEDLK